MRSSRIPFQRATLSILATAGLLVLIWAVSQFKISQLVQDGANKSTVHCLTFKNHTVNLDGWRYVEDGLELHQRDFQRLMTLLHIDIFTFRYPARDWESIGSFSRVYLNPINTKWIELFSFGVLAPTRTMLELRFFEDLGVFESHYELERVLAALFEEAGWTILFHDDSGEWIKGFVLFNALACILGSFVLWRNGRRQAREFLMRGIYRRHRHSVHASRNLGTDIAHHASFKRCDHSLSSAHVASFDSVSFTLSPPYLNATPPNTPMGAIAMSSPTVSLPYLNLDNTGVLDDSAVNNEFSLEQRRRIHKHEAEHIKQRQFHHRVAMKQWHLLDIFAALDQISLGPDQTLQDLLVNQSAHWHFCIGSVILHWMFVTLGAGWAVPLLGLPVEDPLYKITRTLTAAYLGCAAVSMMAYHCRTWCGHQRVGCTVRLLNDIFSLVIFPMSAYLTLTSIVHLALWFCLGLVLKPDVCVPVVVNALVVILYVINALSRLRSRKRLSRRNMLKRQFQNDCIHLHAADESVPGATGREMVVTILGGVTFFGCSILFITLGFYAFSTDKINNVYYTILLSVMPALTAIGAKMFQVKDLVKNRHRNSKKDQGSTELTKSQLRYRELQEDEDNDSHEFITNLCPRHVRFD
jgi:hypothetical protein